MKAYGTILLSMLASTCVHATAAHPTFLFVHGALLTSSTWMSVQSHLQNAGYNVVTVDVPGRADDGIPASDVTLESAADKVCRVASLQTHSVIVVGHSQGGAVITQALDKCAYKIKSLVYVAAVAPLSGEMTFADLSETDNNNFMKCVVTEKESDELKINYAGPLKEMFMADATDAQADRAIHTMVPEPISIAFATLHYPMQVFLSKPKFYIETTQDKIISLATQRKIQSKTKFTETFTLNTSHSPFISQPSRLAEILITIANKVKEGSIDG